MSNFELKQISLDQTGKFLLPMQDIERLGMYAGFNLSSAVGNNKGSNV